MVSSFIIKYEIKNYKSVRLPTSKADEGEEL